MELARLVMDQQVVDDEGELMGKVDGLVLELRSSRQPRVARLLVGGGTLARRIGPRAARWWARWRRVVGPSRDRPTQIPWELVHRVGITIGVSLTADRTPAMAWEDWVRERIIGRLPGA
jgi:sporulation protein YlmC with PRC-barrel domain